MAEFMSEEIKSRIIVEALKSNLRDKLRNHFLEQAKPVIEEMVKDCMADFEVGIKQYMNPMELQTTINFILTDKRSK